MANQEKYGSEELFKDIDQALEKDRLVDVGGMNVVRMLQELKKIRKQVTDGVDRIDDAVIISPQEINQYGRNLLEKFGTGVRGEPIFWSHEMKDFEDK